MSSGVLALIARPEHLRAVDIAGEVTGDVATLTFQCFVGARWGRARLVWCRGMILGHVTADAVCEETWAPSRATLRRVVASWALRRRVDAVGVKGFGGLSPRRG